MPQSAFDMRYAGVLHLDPIGSGSLAVEFEPSPTAYQHAMGGPLDPLMPMPRRQVVRFDVDRSEIEITPIIVYPPKQRFLKPRFDRLKTVLFEGYEVSLPSSEDRVEEALAVLPEGFYRNPEFGLGLPKVLMPFIKQIERLPAVTRLIVSRTRTRGLHGSDLILTHDEVEAALSFLQRVSDRHQRRSLQERNAYAWNKLVSPLDPVAYPEAVPPYSENTIFEALNVVGTSKLKLSTADKTALVTEVGKRVGDLKRAAPEELFRLHRDIELVNLDTLIERCKALLASPDKAEKRWQKLFDLNPFILSMVFGYPIVKVLKEASVGMPLLDGSGAKIADFLTRNPTTSNAALVELKTPQAQLLTAGAYRGSKNSNPVYPPSAELSGAVAQVLDQRYRLQKDIGAHLTNDRTLDLTTYHVDCVVVAGLTPTHDDQRKAFELYRQGLKDVRIVTFDELLLKLESLREVLAGAPDPQAGIGVDDDEDALLDALAETDGAADAAAVHDHDLDEEDGQDRFGPEAQQGEATANHASVDTPSVDAPQEPMTTR